MMKEL